MKNPMQGQNIFELNNARSKNDQNVIRQTGYIIDNKSKTRTIFEINKGANKHDYINVNSKTKGDQKAFAQVDALRKDGRIDMYAEADYSEGTCAHMWLTSKADEIARTIYQARGEGTHYGEKASTGDGHNPPNSLFE